MRFFSKHLLNLLTVIAIALVGLLFLWWIRDSYYPSEAKVSGVETAVSEKATSTATAAIKQTEDAKMTQTQGAADKTATAALWTHTPTHTPTPTHTHTPTPTHTHTPTVTPPPTPTFTPAPTSNPDCYATIKGEDRYLCSVYGCGRIAEVETIRKDTRVRILGKPHDGVWYKVVKENANLPGWLREDFVDLDPQYCDITEYAISHLSSPEMYDEDKKLLIDDTFMGENTWVDLDRQPVRLTIPFPADRRLPEHQLQLITETGVEDQSMFVSPDNKKLLDVGAFTLVTSVDRWNHHFDSYVAFRFLQNGDRYVEARINAGCTVYFLVDGALKQELVLDAGNNKCSADGDEDYITLSLTESRLVEITVNDSRTGRYELPADPSGKYISGRIWLGAYDATMSFNFIVVTSPR